MNVCTLAAHRALYPQEEASYCCECGLPVASAVRLGAGGLSETTPPQPPPPRRTSAVVVKQEEPAEVGQCALGDDADDFTLPIVTRAPSSSISRIPPKRPPKPSYRLAPPVPAKQRFVSPPFEETGRSSDVAGTSENTSTPTSPVGSHAEMKSRISDPLISHRNRMPHTQTGHAPVRTIQELCTTAKNAATTDLSFILAKSSDEELCVHIAPVCLFLGKNPNPDSVEILQRRIAENPVVSQTMHLLQTTGIVPGIFHGRQNPVRPCSDALLFFQRIADAAKELKPGSNIYANPHAVIYHPFGNRRARISHVRVLKIFNSNAKPLLLEWVEGIPKGPPGAEPERPVEVVLGNSKISVLKRSLLAGDDDGKEKNKAGTTGGKPSLPADVKKVTKRLSVKKKVISYKQASAQANASPPPLKKKKKKRNSSAFGTLKRFLTREKSTPTGSNGGRSGSKATGDASSGAVEETGDRPSAVDEKKEKPFFRPDATIEQSRAVIFKVGDDLRQDVAVLHLFRYFNTLWSRANVRCNGVPVAACIYDCIAVGTNMGCIEFVPACRPLSSFSNESFDALDIAVVNRLVATAAGSYTAAFLLGIRDRHSDNILLRPMGDVFHIDFGNILGQKVTLDTARFAITGALKHAMGERWSDFVLTSVKAFGVLRLHAQEIIQYARLVFSSLYMEDRVLKFLEHAFMLNHSAVKACKEVERLIECAPRSYKTRLKNKIHSIAVSRSS